MRTDPACLRVGRRTCRCGALGQRSARTGQITRNASFVIGTQLAAFDHYAPTDKQCVDATWRPHHQGSNWIFNARVREC